MAFMTSEVLRDAMLTALKTELDGGKLYFYQGAVPDIDDDITGRSGDILCEVTESDDGATGLTFDAASAGVITKAVAETWEGTIDQSGTATWYRLKGPNDVDTAGSVATNMRVQGSVGVLNADMLVASVTFTATNVQKVNYYAIGLPNSA